MVVIDEQWKIVNDVSEGNPKPTHSGIDLGGASAVRTIIFENSHRTSSTTLLSTVCTPYTYNSTHCQY